MRRTPSKRATSSSCVKFTGSAVRCPTSAMRNSRCIPSQRRTRNWETSRPESLPHTRRDTGVPPGSISRGEFQRIMCCWHSFFLVFLVYLKTSRVMHGRQKKTNTKIQNTTSSREYTFLVPLRERRRALASVTHRIIEMCNARTLHERLVDHTRGTHDSRLCIIFSSQWSSFWWSFVSSLHQANNPLVLSGCVFCRKLSRNSMHLARSCAWERLLILFVAGPLNVGGFQRKQKRALFAAFVGSTVWKYLRRKGCECAYRLAVTSAWNLCLLMRHLDLFPWGIAGRVSVWCWTRSHRSSEAPWRVRIHHCNCIISCKNWFYSTMCEMCFHKTYY